MISQLINRAYNGISQQLGRQVGLVGLRLHEQAKTKIWARMALDMFFPPVFEVKNAPESLLRSLSIPVVQTPVAPRTTQQRAAAFEIRQAPPPFTSKVMQAVAELNGSAQPAQTTSALGAKIVAAKNLAESQMPVSQTEARRNNVEPNGAEVPLGKLTDQEYKNLGKASQAARKAALARLDGTYAETREVYAMAMALGITIDIFSVEKSDGNPDIILVSTAKYAKKEKTPGDTTPSRIAVYLENEHFEPMHAPPLPDENGFQPAVVRHTASIRTEFGVRKSDPYGNCFYDSVSRLMGGRDVGELRRLACDVADNPKYGKEFSDRLFTNEDSKRHG